MGSLMCVLYAYFLVTALTVFVICDKMFQKRKFCSAQYAKNGNICFDRFAYTAAISLLFPLSALHKCKPNTFVLHFGSGSFQTKSPSTFSLTLFILGHNSDDIRITLFLSVLFIPLYTLPKKQLDHFCAYSQRIYFFTKYDLHSFRNTVANGLVTFVEKINWRATRLYEKNAFQCPMFF